MTFSREKLAAGTLVDEISKTIPFLAIGQDIENVTYSRIGCLSIIMKMMFLCLQFPEPELIATYLICNVQINTDIAKAPLPTTATELLLYIWDGIRCVAHRHYPPVHGKRDHPFPLRRQSVPAAPVRYMET